MHYAISNGGSSWTKRGMVFKDRLCRNSITCTNDGVITEVGVVGIFIFILIGNKNIAIGLSMTVFFITEFVI